jgi:hypothetical protein
MNRYRYRYRYRNTSIYIYIDVDKYRYINIDIHRDICIHTGGGLTRRSSGENPPSGPVRIAAGALERPERGWGGRVLS